MDEKENTNGAEGIVEENEDIENQSNQGGTGSNDSNNASGDDSTDSSKKEKTFTQSQVSRMMTKEKRQGVASVYKELGIDPKDTKAINMVKALIASQKSDEQKAAEKQAEENAKALEAEERVLKAEIKAESMVLGIKREFVEDMVALVMSKKTDDSDIKTLLGEYKKKYHTWFEDSSDGDDSDNKKKAGQRGTGSSIKGDNGGKKGNKDGDNNQSMGQRLAARRKAAVPKKSFWS